MNLTIRCVPEHALDPPQRAALQTLLADCFPGFLDTRLYYKQLPQMRLLAMADDVLVGQVGVEHRVIRIGDDIVRVFGLIDLCVLASERNKGIGGQLLIEATDLAQMAANPIDALLLFADEHSWYETHGFQLVQRQCRWLGIDEHQSIALIDRFVDDCIMLKPLSTASIPEGSIDLMGYMF